MPRINQLPVASSVAQTDVLAIDTSNGTYQVPRSVLAPSPYIADIPASQWSGNSGDYYITVSASNVTPSSILIPNYDENSSRYLIGALWCVPGTGSFTIHTTVLPASTVKILVYFLGVMGEAQYQVLSDVYSKSQTNSLLGAKVNISDIVDNLTTTVAGKVLDARQGKALSDAIAQSTAWVRLANETVTSGSNFDKTVSISSIASYKELLFTLQTSTGRTMASAVVPMEQFQDGAAYLVGVQAISGTITFKTAVFVYISNTSVEIATNNNTEAYKLRMFAR